MRNDIASRLQLLVMSGKMTSLEDIKMVFPDEDISISKARTISEVRYIVNNRPINFLLFEIGDFIQNQDFLKQLTDDYPDVEICVLDRNDKSDQTLVDADIRCKFIQLSKSVYWDEEHKSIEIAKNKLNHKETPSKLDKNFEQFCEDIKVRGGLPIIGISKQIKSIASLILMISKSDDTPVLITGESGTGKELVARAIHCLSKCYKKNFYAVNCAAIPESLFESEFFGYGKGAFTGAAEKSTGWFELANNGTLFLDEISELPKAAQSKFLRILDDKIIQKIGSHQEIKVTLRIISASNQDPEILQNNSILRKDLFYRLNTIHIHIPPLRERKDDIPPLVDYFIQQISKKLNKPQKPICEKSLERLMEYSFPGNVRELRNMIENAVILSKDSKIKLDHFHLSSHSKNNSSTVVSPEKNYNLAALESHLIFEALNKTQFNKSRAAALLKISRQSLDRKITKLGIRL